VGDWAQQLVEITKKRTLFRGGRGHCQEKARMAWCQRCRSNSPPTSYLTSEQQHEVPQLLTESGSDDALEGEESGRT
jgi:hypothetical protein